ncbi:hypothetical protein C942_00926 [Photobacterium marinum]|uniref:Uncharacterized protein n=1 Tax=Photobacterium marinum TaxID=1056511 RepID=L8JE99_9GAMM|nr:hypothetical protein [Photobacterium marinum]ELR65839.1 hypothetical protein C942_00926 [Photobacterium marinum]
MAYMKTVINERKQLVEQVKNFFLNNPASHWKLECDNETTRFSVSHKTLPLAAAFGFEYHWMTKNHINVYGGTGYSSGWPGLVNERAISSKYRRNNQNLGMSLPCYLHIIANEELFGLCLVNLSNHQPYFAICSRPLGVGAGFAGDNSGFFIGTDFDDGEFGSWNIHRFGQGESSLVYSEASNVMLEMKRTGSCKIGSLKPIYEGTGNDSIYGRHGATGESMSKHMRFELSNTRLFLPWLLSSKQANGRYAPVFALGTMRITSVEGIEVTTLPYFIEYRGIPWLVIQLFDWNKYKYGLAIKLEARDVVPTSNEVAMAV